MYWHIDTDIVSLIVITAIYIYNQKLQLKNEHTLRNQRFSMCLLSGIVITAIDIAASVIMEVPCSRFLYHLLMTAYFIGIELVIVEWLIYVATILYQDDAKGRKRVLTVVLGIYFLYALFNILNPWTGAVYTLGPNNEYQRGPFFSGMLILFAGYTVGLTVLLLVRWRSISRESSRGLMLATPMIIGAAIYVQLTNEGWLMIMPSYMICLVLAFLFFQNVQMQDSRMRMQALSSAAQTDQLTGLLNRAGMEAMAEKTLAEESGRKVFVMIVDIDNLKRINDTMGHQIGDEVIRGVAAQLKSHFRASDTVVRYGGDEFLAFLTGDMNETQMRQSIERLLAEIAGRRFSGDGVVIHVSIGAVYGIVGPDPFATLCRKADAALYHVKRSGKNGYAFFEPGMEVKAVGAEAPDKPR